MTCPRCGRLVFPLLTFRRPDTCSPKEWRYCVRQYADVRRELQRAAAKRADAAIKPDAFLANHPDIQREVTP